MTKLFVCKFDELLKYKYKVKFVDEWKDEIIAFVDINKEVKVFSSICPHFGGPILFNFRNNQLKCKWHAWKFCAKTGKCLSYSIKSHLKEYKHLIEGENLYVLSDKNL